MTTSLVTDFGNSSELWRLGEFFLPCLQYLYYTTLCGVCQGVFSNFFEIFSSNTAGCAQAPTAVLFITVGFLLSLSPWHLLLYHKFRKNQDVMLHKCASNFLTIFVQNAGGPGRVGRQPIWINPLSPDALQGWLTPNFFNQKYFLILLNILPVLLFIVVPIGKAVFIAILSGGFKVTPTWVPIEIRAGSIFTGAVISQHF